MADTARWQISCDAAQIYEQVMVPAIFAPWGRDLLAVAAPAPGERVLDVACATGLVARLAAESVGARGAVTALDLNPEMLDVARSLPPTRGAGIRWVEGDVVAMPLRDAHFDLVLCQQGIQYFPDRPHALAEMHRVLAPGGRALVSVWQGDTAYTRSLADALEPALGRDASNSMRRALTCPRATAIVEVMQKAGFREVAVHTRTLIREIPDLSQWLFRHLGATPHADAVARLDEGTRRQMLTRMFESLGPYRHGNLVRYPEAVSLMLGWR